MPAAALGLQAQAARVEGGAEYADLLGAPAGLNVEVQRVDHPSRVHLDIESDDIDAEADRLEKLGARRIGFVKRWWVMEAPTGHRFCIACASARCRPISGPESRRGRKPLPPSPAVTAPAPRSVAAVIAPAAQRLVHAHHADIDFGLGRRQGVIGRQLRALRIQQGQEVFRAFAIADLCQ